MLYVPPEGAVLIYVKDERGQDLGHLAVAPDGQVSGANLKARCDEFVEIARTAVRDA